MNPKIISGVGRGQRQQQGEGGDDGQRGQRPQQEVVAEASRATKIVTLHRKSGRHAKHEGF
jgi:hypothetical protein